VAGIAGQLFWASMCGRVITHNAVLAVIGALMAAASGATAFATAAWDSVLLLGLASLFGFTAAGFIPVVLGAVMGSSTTSQAAALTSALNIFLIGSSLVGPLAFGGIARGFGYPGAFVALAALCLAGALTCVVGHVIATARPSGFARPSMSAGEGTGYLRFVWVDPGSGKTGGRHMDTLAELLALPLRNCPDAVAITGFGKQISFAEIERDARALAATFISTYGARPGDRIVVLADKRPSIVAVGCAIWKAGCVYVPVDVKSPS